MSPQDVTRSGPCEAPDTSCGTPSGWRAGGRCRRCRAAHNAETRRYRGVTRKQRDHVLTLLRAGRSVEQAAIAAGVTLAQLQTRAVRDGGLRAALEGGNTEDQAAAEFGDYLQALIQHNGEVQLALTTLNITYPRLAKYREANAAFRDAEAALLTWLGQRTMTRNRMTPAQLDYAAELLRQGMPITQAAREAGTGPGNLRVWAGHHAALKAALPPKKFRGPSKRTAQVEERLRELWATPTSVAHIAAELGVTPQTVGNWVNQLGLPRRLKRKPRRR